MVRYGVIGMIYNRSILICMRYHNNCKTYVLYNIRFKKKKKLTHPRNLQRFL